MKKLHHGFGRHPYIYSIVIILLLIIAGFFVFGGNGDDYETLSLERTTFKRQVSVSGKVIASQSAELGFEQGGRIARVNAPVGKSVNRGTVLASIENGDLQAEVLQKKAALEREQAKLASLRQGTRPEQLTIDRQEYVDATAALVVAGRTAELQLESALLSKIDTLFENGSSVNPTLDVSSPSETIKRRVENERLLVTDKLADWKSLISTLNERSGAAEINSALQTSDLVFDALDSLVNSLNTITNDLSTNNSGLSEAEIDAHRESVNNAAQEISSALNDLEAAKSEWQSARNSLALSEAGTTPTDLGAQLATIKAAEADLISAQARLAKTNIVAPFDGVVTKMDLKVGEIVSPNTSGVSLMSSAKFEIESFVPEVHIANIQSGQSATVNLDAYGTEVPFRATVSSIDPAETIRDGVSTYKVKLAFSESDSRIRSGMTASVIITTLEKPETLVVPKSVITEKDGETIVRRLVNEEIVEVPVVTGDSTTLGQIEIVSGLSEGDVVILDEPSE